MSHHHILPIAVFGEGERIEVCRTPCHDALNELIREKENAILQEHQEIYLDALKQISGNHKTIAKYFGKIAERQKRRIRK